jgi:protein involved in polysaccharide export with SLBB domain
MRPDDHDISAIPGMPLEDGDHLLVPPLPTSINVVGSVYNQNSFLFEQGRRAGDYLREAGGASRLADSRHEFIVRADGAVVSRTFSEGKLASGFGSEHMSPGDTIIVPEKLINPSALRLFLSYSTAFSSLALTAAALAVLR